MTSTRPTKYQIRTPRGYVGSYSIPVELCDDMDEEHGYVYRSRADAEFFAADFEGAEIVEWS